MRLLSTEFLQQLTGRKSPKLMIDWLRNEGFVFRVGADGYPKVEEEHYLEVMNGGRRLLRNRTPPNFQAMSHQQK
jgi:hypothetical protein